MRKKLSRRELLRLLALVAGKAGIGALTGCKPLAGRAADDLEPRAYLPLVMGGESSAVIPTPTAQTPMPPPTGSRVVHVHNSRATSWNGQTDFWNYVDQTTVDTMVDQGMKALTGTSTVAEAWDSLLPDYSPGEIVAIKVNFNNSTACNDADAQIDALMQPVNAVIRALKLIGVPEKNIWIYDASRHIPDRFVAANLYSNVVFLDRGCRQPVTWSSDDPDAYVTFLPPSGHPALPATRIDDVLIDCAYLINMPIMKPHGIAGITLTFKNHFGDITSPWNLHPYIDLGGASYRADYNPLVDIYRNPHIGEKTVLVVGDGLIASLAFDGPPSLWGTFGNHTPNSLFFATDPVAIDCVMCDFLAAEISIPAEADDYLVLAEQDGLGTYERGDPWGVGYTVIDYVKIVGASGSPL